jgi:hypothetical protein
LDELLFALMILAMVLGAVTLVGHGLWVLLAALFRRSRADDGPPTGLGPAVCPRCLTPRPDSGVCSVCDWPGYPPVNERRAKVLLAIERQLVRYAHLGLISQATRKELMASLRGEPTVAPPVAAAAATDFASGPAPTEATAAAPSGAAINEEPVVLEVVEEAESVDPPPLAPEPIEKTSSPEERVRNYVASRTAEGVAVDRAPPAPVPERRRPAFGKLFAAFLEEKNVRWGELVGGLLIVCCSIALVISFWSEIADRPLLKFLVFNGVSAALFGAGFYTERHWKIHTTSRGLLLIAILLVPLNFLAIAAFTDKSPPTDVLSLGGEAVSLALFTWLVHAAARVVTPEAARLVAVGVMLPSLMQLLTRRFAGPDAQAMLLYGLAAAPIGAYVGSCGLELKRLSLLPNLGEQSSNRLFIVLGATTYAMLLPLALLLYKTGTPLATLERLAPLMTIAGLPGLATGLLFWRRRETAERPAETTAGLGVGVLGAAMMIGALVLAWPQPGLLLVTAVANALVFNAVAWWFSIPQANLAAGLCVIAAWVVGFHAAWGDLSLTADESQQVLSALLSATSGNALVPLVGVLLAVAFGLNRLGRWSDAVWWAASAGAAAACSVGLIAAFGFARPGDPYRVAWTLGIYAIAATLAAIKSNRAIVSWGASALILATIVQDLVFRRVGDAAVAQPWVVSLLVHASIATLVAIMLRRINRGHSQAEEQAAWLQSAQLTALLAIAVIALRFPTLSWNALSLYTAWLAVVWLVQAVGGPRKELLPAFHFTLLASLFCAVTAQLATRGWYLAASRPWLDPWFLQTQGVALAVYATIWSAARMAAARFLPVDSVDPNVQAASWRTALREAVATEQTAPILRGVEAAAVVLLVVTSLYAAAPGVCQELWPLDRPGLATRVAPPTSAFELAGIPHERAAGQGAWALLAAVSVMLLTAVRARGAMLAALGLPLAATAGCFVAATWWESGVSLASALRWLLAGLFLVSSAILWSRSRWAMTARSLGLRIDGERAGVGGVATREAYQVLNVLLALPHVAMAAWVAVVAIQKSGGAQVPQTMWVLSAIAFLCSLVGALASGALNRLVSPKSASEAAGESPSAISPTAAVALALGCGPLLVTGGFALAAALKLHPLTGPEPGAWFRQIGWSASYGVPLAVIIAALVGTAIRERSSVYAFAAGLLTNVVATLVYLLEMAKAGRTLDGVTWIEVAQINAIVAAVVALMWRAAIWRYSAQQAQAQREDQSALSPATPALLYAQALMAAVLCGLFLAPSIVGLIVQPAASSWLAAAGGPLGWAAVGLSLAAVWFNAQRRLVASVDECGWGVLSIVCLMALTVAYRYGGSASLAGYLTLLAGLGIAGWLMSFMRSTRRGDADEVAIEGMPNDDAIRWSAWLGTACIVVAARTLPLSCPAWWTIGGLTAMALLAARLAWIAQRRGFMWIFGLLWTSAGAIAWLEYGNPLPPANVAAALANAVLATVLAAALACLASVFVERRRILLASADDLGWNFPSFHRFASWAAIAALLLLTAVGLAADSAGAPIESHAWLRAASLAATVLASFACLWDPAARLTAVGLYGAGLLAVGMFLDSLNVSGQLFTWSLTIALAAFALATSYLWSRRDALYRAAARMGAPLADAFVGETYSTSGSPAWIVSANSLIAAAVTAMVFWIEVTNGAYAQRIVAAYAVLAAALALAFLAQGAMRSGLQYAALVLGALFAVALAWSWLPVPMEAGLLHRTAAAAVALTVVIPLYGFGLVKLWRRENEWTAAAARLVPGLCVVATALLLLVLGIEVAYYLDDGVVPIRLPALVAVAAGLVALAVAALAAALLPGRDPLGLSERGRMLYVYAAEAVLGLLFLHIRVTMPWLFRGWFLQFWPLVVMGVAFLGVGIAEWCRRRQQRVLFEPLENTGALLPMLPVLGYWLLPSDINYSLVLLSVGALYSVLSVLRRSFLFGLLATLAANGSLWYLLHQSEAWSFFQHPQIWLIPPALCMLAAAYMNRSRLSAEQMTTIRYIAAIVIYASSTADIFVNGVGEAPWLPLVLAGLSILGIVAGIWVRVQAFLYLGFSFLLIALFTMIWYAAVELDRTWIWWVSGIVAGVLIIALFGLFEKKRDEILRLAERVKQWEA